MEALRCLKRRLSDAVFRVLLVDLAGREHTAAAAEDAGDQPDLQQLPEAGPGGHLGATLKSSPTGPTPTAGSSDKSLPGPANQDATPDRQHLPEAS
jgi:transposase